MALTFQDLQNGVLRLAPNQISTDPSDPSSAPNIVNDAYGALLRYTFWIDCIRLIPVVTATPYTAGSVAVSSGNNQITGTGTLWLANVAAGEYITVGNNSRYRIVSVGSDTSLTIEQPWMMPAQSGVGYTISGPRIALPDDAERVLYITYQNWMLERDNQFMLNLTDPSRTVYGDPLSYSEVTTFDGNNGVKEIELWPVPSSSKSYIISYRAAIPPLVDPDDTPVLPGDVIMKAAQAETCLILASRTGEQIWLAMSSTFAAAHQELRDSLARENRRRWGSRSTVMDSEDIPNLNDPGWSAAYRAVQALALTRIA